MQKTALNAVHHALGAKMVPFGGFEMPVQYAGIIEEHKVVRNAVGVFDVSHMGEFEVQGPNALPFLQRITINDVSKLTEGKAQYSAMCNEKGGIIDDLLVYHCGDRYLLVVNASNIDKDLAWVRSNVTDGVTVRDRSEDYSLLAVQGPRSEETLQMLTEVRLSDIPSYAFKRGEVAGHPAMISRTGYTGEKGFELYLEGSPKAAEDVWHRLFESGKRFGIAPIGLGARDTLRLEMGYCLYGNDIDDSTTPLQAGLGWITKLAKGEFIGRSVIEREKSSGPARLLVGLRLPERTIARHGFPVMKEGQEVGHVTSGTFSPTLQSSVAMAYVASAHAVPGSTVDVQIRDRSAVATIVKTPFIQRSA